MSTTVDVRAPVPLGPVALLAQPQSRYFTLLLPIVFLVIFAAIFKGTTVVDGRQDQRSARSTCRGS